MNTRRKPGVKEEPKESRQGLEVSGEGGGDEKKETTKDKRWLRKVRLGTFEDSGLCKGCMNCECLLLIRTNTFSFGA